MIISSIIYAVISLIIILGMIGVVIWKQFELASSAVYFMLALLVGIGGWIIGDMLQIIFSKPESLCTVQPSCIFWVDTFSRFATISSMVAMVSTVLFARVLSARRTLNSKTVATAFLLFGGTVFITLTDAYNVLEYVPELDFSPTEAHIVWIITDATMVLFAGGVLIWYLSRQYRFVEKKHRKVISFMITGTIIAFIASAVIYAFYAIAQNKTTLHLELLTAAIGASMLGIGMIWGGKRALYGSSRVYSVHIFDTNGLSVYAGLFEGKYDVNEHLISGVATAISNFAGQLIGKDVIPREIDLGDYSLMLEQKHEYIGFIICEFPSVLVRQGLKNLMNEFDPSKNIDEITEFIDDFLPYGKPIVMNIFDELLD